MSSSEKALPNPSIKRTNNGGQRLRARARTAPPLFAAYLQRWASQNTRRLKWDPSNACTPDGRFARTDPMQLTARLSKRFSGLLCKRQLLQLAETKLGPYASLKAKIGWRSTGNAPGCSPSSINRPRGHGSGLSGQASKCSGALQSWCYCARALAILKRHSTVAAQGRTSCSQRMRKVSVLAGLALQSLGYPKGKRNSNLASPKALFRPLPSSWATHLRAQPAYLGHGPISIGCERSDAQPFLQADVPSARRLSQTLGATIL